jgi:hypothetical protein
MKIWVFEGGNWNFDGKMGGFLYKNGRKWGKNGQIEVIY